MATLQRSTVSFRREGSSGVVWDDKFFSEEIKQMIQNEDIRELRPCQSTGNIGMMNRSGSNNATAAPAAPPTKCPRSFSTAAVNLNLPSSKKSRRRLMGVLPKPGKAAP